MVELSSGRQALEGASLAPGSGQTLNSLRDPERRPPRPRDPIPRDILEHQPAILFELEEFQFVVNLRTSRRGAAAGPSGTTSDHLRPLFDHVRDSHLLFLLADQLAKAKTPASVNDANRLGRLTALQKPSGGVRGIVAGDIMRRLVARTMSHQLSKAVESATARFQYAMTTMAGTECIAHVLQALTESNPQYTIMTVDGIDAFDLISRASMLGALRDVEGGSQALPFVRYLWEDSVGVVHHVDQGEGGEQGDVMMPLLLSLGQHAALQAVQGRLVAGERLMAFLDDVYVATPTPDRVGSIYTTLDVDLYRHARIRINRGKTQVWNAAGIRPGENQSPKKQIRQQAFGGDRICLSFSSASQFWAHSWAVLSSCRPICKKLWRIMTLSSLGFRCWTTRGLLGHCCCIGPGAEPITC